MSLCFTLLTTHQKGENEVSADPSPTCPCPWETDVDVSHPLWVGGRRCAHRHRCGTWESSSVIAEWRIPVCRVLESSPTYTHFMCLFPVWRGDYLAREHPGDTTALCDSPRVAEVMVRMMPIARKAVHRRSCPPRAALLLNALWKSSPAPVLQ